MSAVALMLIYAAAVGSASLWDFAAGAAVAAIGLHRFREFVLPHPDTGLKRHPGAIGRGVVRLIGGTARMFAAGTWHVVSRWSAASHAGFIELPLDPQESDSAVAIAALVASITPELTFVEMDRERRVLVFHALDATDTAAIRRQYRELNDRYVRPFFD